MIDDFVGLLGLYLKGLGALDVMVGVILQGDVDALPGADFLAEHVAVMVPVAPFDDFGGKIAIGLPVHPEHPFISLNPGIDE